MQSTDSIEEYTHGTSKYLVNDKEEIKCNNIRNRYKTRLTLMVLSNKISKKHNPNRLQIPHDPQRMLTIGGSGSLETNPMFNLINQQRDIDKTDLYAKDTFEAKYQFLTKKCEDVRPKDFKDSKAFTESSNSMIGIYKNIDDYNLNKKRKILIVLDDMIADLLSNKKFNPIVNELIIRNKQITISFVFITQSYSAVPMKQTKFCALF